MRLSPGGVRIRSVRDNRRIIIIAPPMRVVGPSPAPDTAFRDAAASREDLARLESRLQEYFDSRIRQLETVQREAFLSLYRSAGETGPRGYPGASQTVVVPIVAPLSALADTAVDSTLAADSTRMAVTGVSDTLARDTSAPFFGLKPPATATLLPPGAGVDEIERALLAGELLRSVSIIFEFDSAELLPASLPILNALGWALARNPALRLEISGHTDSSGPAEYNMTLSRARAATVRDYLITTHSVSGERLVARGFGESMPIADESTATGRALNRRVEFFMLQSGEPRGTPHPAGERNNP